MEVYTEKDKLYPACEEFLPVFDAVANILEKTVLMHETYLKLRDAVPVEARESSAKGAAVALLQTAERLDDLAYLFRDMAAQVATRYGLPYIARSATAEGLAGRFGAKGHDALTREQLLPDVHTEMLDKVRSMTEKEYKREWQKTLTFWGPGASSNTVLDHLLDLMKTLGG